MEPQKCFLDHRTVSWLQLPPEPLKAPRTIHNIDGTHNQAGHITHKCRLKVQLETIHQEMDFFITNLGQDFIILGNPFLKLFNPNINWTKGNLTQTSTVFITPVHLWKHCQLVWKEDKIFCIWKTTFAQQWASKAKEGKTTLTDSDIPASYLDHKAVFFEEEAWQMPPSWDEDMQITFKEGASSQLDCKVYPLTKVETEVLQQSIKEDLQKGYICHGTSSFISPIFFIPKKDGKELQMVIDYRKLNDITKKNFYPLSNLWTKLEKLSKHSLFSKFDVHVGYNNIRIRREDQHKAAFKTPLGTFVPTVMTFGFCNAPSIFQRAMNCDLAPLQQKYPDNFSNYMDDVAIGTSDALEGRRLHCQIIKEFLKLLKLIPTSSRPPNVNLRRPRWNSSTSPSRMGLSKLTQVKLKESLIALSRRPDYDKGREDNFEVVPLPASLFTEQLQTATLDALIQEDHAQNKDSYVQLQNTHHWELEEGLWRKDGQIAVLLDDLRKAILKENHDHPLAGHPGAATTYFSVRRHYWWPELKDYV